MENSKKYLTPLIIFGVLLLCLVLATLFDLNISKALCGLKRGQYLSSNPALQISEIFGETVLYALVSASAFAIYFSKGRLFSNTKRAEIIAKAIGVFIAFGINTFATFKVMGYLGEHFGFADKLEGFLACVSYILGGIILSGIWYLIMSKMTVEIAISGSIWSLIVIFTAILSQILVQSFKPIFGRVRFRTMNFLNDFSLYTRWFRVGNLSMETKAFLNDVIGSDAYKSFPSGHTACASSLITLTALIDIFDKFKRRKWKVLLWSSAIGYTAILALSRVVIGAHFASDVLFAIIITYGSFYIFKWIFLKIFKKLSNGGMQATEGTVLQE